MDGGGGFARFIKIMSEKSVSAGQVQNSELLREIAAKLLKATTTPNGTVTRVDTLVNAFIDEKFRELHLPALPVRIESQVELHLTAEDSEHLESSGDDLWIFGYGSLVWKADFPYVSRRIGFIKGFERRFYQNSIDHRGTAEKPGRVVTLLPSSDPNSLVWGVAYRIAAQDREDVIKHLDFREKNGYERHATHFYPYSPDHGTSFSPQDIVVYVATEQNDSYVGHINDLDLIADQVYLAEGPSGTNREYVYKLANAVRQLFPGEVDAHLFALEEKVREREARDIVLIRKLKEDITEIIEGAVKCKVENLDTIRDLVNRKFQEFSEKYRKTRSNGKVA